MKRFHLNNRTVKQQFAIDRIKIIIITITRVARQRGLSFGRKRYRDKVENNKLCVKYVIITL